MIRKNQLLSFHSSIYREKGSKFIGYTYGVFDDADIPPILEQLKKDHFAARHWCYAYRLGENGARYRSNDDGEPVGTAGRPILSAIDQLNLTNTLVVVVRYFGGTLLGVRGLIDAYGGAAQQALALCETAPLPLVRQLRISCSYEQFSEVQKIINELLLKPRITYEQTGLILHFIGDLDAIEPAQRRFESLYHVNILPIDEEIE
ncbi:MAG: YigZ family protein [Sphingobacteriaceae bacterium]|nr:YigZ family protein [Sphingobacteriaceae bacterium]